MNAFNSSVTDLTLECDKFKLILGSNAKAKSLVIKGTNEECVDCNDGIPFFSSTQERPFNNETKLANPNTRTTYHANRLRPDGKRLIVGFETAPYEAIVSVRTGAGYIAFSLEEWISNTTDEHQYLNLAMDVPPVAEFHVAQLTLKKRQNFGHWLNVVWDEKAAIAVIAGDPLVAVDSEHRNGYTILSATLARDRETIGGSAIIVGGVGEVDFMSSMESAEHDFGMPQGVSSRRDPRLNASIYWTGNANPENIDRHIELARKGGFRMMLFYHSCFAEDGSYRHLGDYDWSKNFPNGEVDLKCMLDKVKAAGITPGFHTLQTHIGLESRYITPVADHRLNKTRRYTLASKLGVNDDVVYVEESTINAPTHEKCRVLQFGGELILYTGYTKSRPYCFTGCSRGAFKTNIAEHHLGEIGGTLDISEFAAISCYIDQKTSLQDEVAEKIAKIYDAGMEFCYFDGSEGVDPPCGINVSLAQYRTVSKFKKQPLFTEGAAKSHYGWHLQAGANAFDVFKPEVFKEKIAEYPLAEAPVMRKDFTRLDFGWWVPFVPDENSIGTQPDMWEYGTSKAAAWDCPATVIFDPDTVTKHPRIDDCLEVMRRWEDVRAKKWLTKEQKELLRNPQKEYHLFKNINSEYELVEIEMLPTHEKAPHLRGFVFEYNGQRIVAYWHTHGSGTVEMSANSANPIRLQADKVKYFKTACTIGEIRIAWNKSKEV